MMRAKIICSSPDEWIDELPESLRHEFSMEELEQMKQQFLDFDTSGDGSIAPDELFVLMKSMGVEITIDEIQELIDRVDDNYSGELEYPEFVRLISEFRRGSGDKLAYFIQHSKLVLSIRMELKDLNEHPTAYCSVEGVKENAWEWNGRINGPVGSPYEEKTYRFQLRFSEGYPYEAPALTWFTPIYHPNFIPLLNGKMQIYGLLGNWESHWRARNLLDALEALLSEPNENAIEKFIQETDRMRQYQPPNSLSLLSRASTMECIALYRSHRDKYISVAQSFG